MKEDRFVYENKRLHEISFPLGGIGSGSIGLAGNGRLIEWEIFNRPNKNTVQGFSHFAVKAENKEHVLDARVMHGDLDAPYQYIKSHDMNLRGGFSVPREFMTGFPHFSKVRFTGKFPIAEIDFFDERFPGDLNLLAFNPFIPGNDFDSSIPAAFFSMTVKNTTSEQLRYTIALSLIHI